MKSGYCVLCWVSDRYAWSTSSLPTEISVSSPPRFAGSSSIPASTGKECVVSIAFLKESGQVVAS